MKVVIDTNIFVSALYGGNPREIIDLWKKGKLILCLTQEIFEEYIDVFLRFKIMGNELKELFDLFAEGHSIDFVSKTPKLNIVKNDPSDNKFFECAIAAKAPYLISGDKEILCVKKYITLKVVAAKEFLKQCI